MTALLSARSATPRHTANHGPRPARRWRARPLTRPLSSVLLPLVIQHWFCLLKYQSENAYIVVELFLEMVWEW